MDHNVKWRFVAVRFLVVLVHSTTLGREAAEILRACKLEHSEDITPMDNQPSNVNFGDELGKW